MFFIKKWDIHTQKNAIKFHFTCQTYGDFCEVITFPENVKLSDYESDKKFHRLLNMMAAYLGVSYYKLAALNEVHCDYSFLKAEQKSIEKLHMDGLGEFYIRNNLQYPPPLSFHYAEGKISEVNFVDEEHSRQVQSPTAIVAFGGGKDSHVSIALLDTLNIQQDLVSVVLADSVQKTLQKLSHKKITFIHRRIDPKLISLVKEGKGYNGHIPITAINSIILSSYAYLTKNNWVVFSNERGASVPTMHHGAYEINHQYSKSFDFEALFRNALQDICGDDVQYFSLLRPFSELWIAAYLGKEAIDSHDYFSSCNKNFIFEGKGKLPTGQRWCGKCSKCVYTAIIMAPYLSQTNFLHIFGGDILNDSKNLQIIKDLCGIGGKKPWECVGDFVDTAASFFTLFSQKEWAENGLPQNLANDLQAKYGGDYLIERLKLEISSRSAHFLPDQLSRLY